MRLTDAQIRERERLAVKFREAIEASLWTAIDACPRELLCSDDGVPYGEQRFGTGTSQLEAMVASATKAADKYLRLWL